MANGGGGNSNAILGALVGGVGGAIGGFFESRERRRAQERFRREQAAGIQDARRITEERVNALLENPLIASASDFIGRSFSTDDDPLTQQFQRRLRVAQESRGIRRSTAGAVAEASSLAAFRQQFLQSLLPQALEFGSLGERFRGQILAQETPINVASRTGAALPGITPPAFVPSAGLNAFSQGISGFAGGLQAGAQFDQSARFNSQLEELRALNARSTAPRGLNTGGPATFQSPSFDSTLRLGF